MVATLKTWDQQVRDLHDEIKGAVSKGSLIRVERARVLGVHPVEGQDRTVEYIASDETVDRYGDIVRVKGWDLKTYEAAQTFLWAHSYDTLPLGQALKTWKHKDGSAPELRAWLQYAPRELSEFADTVYRMVLARILRSVSVGFAPKTWNDPEDPKEREKLGLGSWGLEFTAQELMEISQVPVPANPNANAVTMAADLGLARNLGEALKEADARKIFGKDEARIFMRDAGDVYAAEVMPVLRDLSLLPSAGTVAVIGEGKAVDKSSNAVINLDTSTLKASEALTIVIRRTENDVSAGDAKIVVDEALKEIARQEIKAGIKDIVREIAASVIGEEIARAKAGQKPEPDPKMATAAPDPEDAATRVLSDGIKDKLERALTGFASANRERNSK